MLVEGAPRKSLQASILALHIRTPGGPWHRSLLSCILLLPLLRPQSDRHVRGPGQTPRGPCFTLGVLPVLALSYYTPLFVAHCASNLELRHRAVWFWHMFPVWTVVGQHVLAWTVMPKTIVTDRMQNPKRDL
ncbi:hypothetical protein GJ744_009154 [Endocarpon pusillum]|uniref:Uncharacterized protein n=1 Tax=Endocarpon pusillum TaxID=364733 RepID=A0A8H7AGA2_9EURO|nr:hypothetical protein GJ744_009154 [Endocarpon pusillum]